MNFLLLGTILYTMQNYALSAKFKFCYDYECPKFNVIHKAISYEVRCYGPSEWIERHNENVGNTDILSDWKLLFKDLFKYKSGFNEQKIRWKKKSSPIRVRFSSGANLNKMAMQFYIPKDTNKQVSVSKPLNNKVKLKINTMEECFYVHGFRSNKFRKTFKKTLSAHLEILKEAIFNEPFVRKGEQVTSKLAADIPFYFNTYSSPRTEARVKRNQYYEIMIAF